MAVARESPRAECRRGKRFPRRSGAHRRNTDAMGGPFFRKAFSLFRRKCRRSPMTTSDGIELREKRSCRKLYARIASHGVVQRPGAATRKMERPESVFGGIVPMKRRLKARIPCGRENYMTTPVQQKIRDQKRTPEQIAQRVQSGDRVNHGSTGGDSTVCTEAAARRPGCRRRDPTCEKRRNFKIPMGSAVWGYDWDQGFQSGK